MDSGKRSMIWQKEEKLYILTGHREVWIGEATSLPKMVRTAPPPPWCVPNEYWLLQMTSNELAFGNIKFKLKTIVDQLMIPKEENIIK
jgi:hypothetical protein